MAGRSLNQAKWTPMDTVNLEHRRRAFGSIKILTGYNTMYQKLGYRVRQRAADMLDRMVAMNYGALAMQSTDEE